jgi:hypothetical protein
VSGISRSVLDLASYSLLMFAATSASAQIHKCQVDGKVTYSDQPCEKGRQSSVTVVPNTMDGTYLRDESARARREQARAPVPGPAAEPAPPPSCQGARRFAYSISALKFVG